MRPELATLADWLRSSGRMAHVHYGRLLSEVIAILERTLFMINGSTDIDVEGLASALPTVDTHPEAAVVDHDPAALVFRGGTRRPRLNIHGGLDEWTPTKTRASSTNGQKNKPPVPICRSPRTHKQLKE